MPECYIRLDRSHFIRYIHRLPIWKTNDYRKVKLIKNVLGYLIQCDDFTSFMEVVKKLFTMLLNPFDGGELPAENAKKSIILLISTHNIQLDENENDDIVINDSLFDSQVTDSSWISNIIENIIVSTNRNHHDNLYYFPEAIETLANILYRAPLWSNILMHKFHSNNNCSTSSDIESYFRIIKHDLFEKKMVRADKFIKNHTIFLDGELKKKSSVQIKAIATSNNN